MRVLAKRVLLLSAISLLFACDRGSQRQKEASISDTQVEQEFGAFIQRYIPQLEQVLIKHNLNPTESESQGKKKVDWSVTKSPKESIEKGYPSATVMIFGERSFQDQRLAKIIFLWFVRKEGQWHLMLKNGYLTRLGAEEADLLGLSPDVHEEVKKIFPRTMEVADALS